MPRWLRVVLALAGLATALWMARPGPVRPPVPRASPAAGLEPALAPPRGAEEQRRLAELAHGEELIGLALRSGQRETLVAAHQQLSGLARQTGYFGPFYVLKYHLAWLEGELGMGASANLDGLERAGFRYVYGRGRENSARTLQDLTASRTADMMYWEAGHESLRLETARQLGSGMFTGQRMNQRRHLFRSMGIRGLKVVDYACGTGVALIPLLEAVGPSGEVYAVDVAQSVLDFIAQAARDLPELRRVKPVLAQPTDSGLPSASVDVVFLDGFVIQPRTSGVYGTKVRPLVRSLHRILRDGGRVVVWPYDRTDEEMGAIFRENGFSGPAVAPMGGRDPKEHALVFRKE